MIDPPPAEFDLGQRLKWVRERNGLSQRELARRAGVTNSNISMIEQGAVSPTVNSLTRLLDVIPLSLAQFFACDPERDSGAIYRAGELRSLDRKSTRLNSSHVAISYAVFCLKKKRIT